jgi:hypothetical protein
VLARIRAARVILRVHGADGDDESVPEPEQAALDPGGVDVGDAGTGELDEVFVKGVLVAVPVEENDTFR